jgi:hypothetical protein
MYFKLIILKYLNLAHKYPIKIKLETKLYNANKFINKGPYNKTVKR